MPTTDLEDLLKMRTILVPESAVLYLLILDMAQNLRDENPGNTILKVFSRNPNWVDRKIAVLPNPMTEEVAAEITVELDKSLQPDQMEFVYFDAFEVERF